MSADENGSTWWSDADAAQPVDITATPAADAPASGKGRKRLVTVASVAAGVALTGGVALAAASGGSSSSASSQQGQFGGPPGTSGQQGQLGGPPGATSTTGGTTGSTTGGTAGTQGGFPMGAPPGQSTTGGATTGGTTSGTAPLQGGNAQGGPGGFGGRGMGGPGMGLGMAIHGEFVVKDTSGSYVTELSQRGTVTAISATSITVKSADDYSHTYVIPSSVTVTSIKTGSSVDLVATVSGDTATLANIHIEGAFSGMPGGTGGQPPAQGTTGSTTGNA